MRRSPLLVAMSMLLPFALAAAEGMSERHPRYRLQASDELEIRFKLTPEFDDEVTVQPDGFVTLAVGAEARVAGLTIPEATEAIRTACSDRLRNPLVTVLLQSFEKPHVVISGEVKSPGKYDYRESLTIMQGIAVAGGLNHGAKKSQVVLFRSVSEDLVESRVINIKSMYSGKSLEEDISLQPGDILVIPKSRLAKLERFMSVSKMTLFVPLF